MKKLSLITMLGAFALILTAYVSEARAAGPEEKIKLECPPTNARSLEDCKRKCGTNCPPVKVVACRNSCEKMTFEEKGGGSSSGGSSSGGSSSGGGGGGTDWCAKYEECKDEFLALIPACEAEGIEFDGKNCRAQYKACVAAKKVAPQIEVLCANKEGCELVPCMYMDGAMVPAEACIPGCPEWYIEEDGKCLPVTCEPICADEAQARFEAALPGFPIELLYALLAMGAVGLVLLIIVLVRQSTDDKEKPATKSGDDKPGGDNPGGGKPTDDKSAEPAPEDRPTQVKGS